MDSKIYNQQLWNIWNNKQEKQKPRDRETMNNHLATANRPTNQPANRQRKKTPANQAPTDKNHQLLAHLAQVPRWVAEPRGRPPREEAWRPQPLSAWCLRSCAWAWRIFWSRTMDKWHSFKYYVSILRCCDWNNISIHIPCLGPTTIPTSIFYPCMPDSKKGDTLRLKHLQQWFQVPG